MRDLAAMLDLLTQGTWRTDVLVFAVGAVYDRTTFASGWARCAVIDRAYRCAKPARGFYRLVLTPTRLQ